MSRFVSPFERVTDSDNKPIVGAKLFFYETGTKTLKTIYLDFENTIPAENPVLSLAGGINPDRYINGIYNVVQTDNTGAVGVEGALIWERDPIGDLETGPFSDWNSTSFYSLNDVVKGSDLAYYISTVAGINTNQGNDPISSPSDWDLYQAVLLDATQTLTNKTINGGTLQQGTVQPTTSGTSVTFLDIPSWVKKIIVSLDSVSMNGAGGLSVQIGTSSGLDTTADYAYSTITVTGAVLTSGNSIVAGSWLVGATVVTSDLVNGHIIITLVDTNDWSFSSNIQNVNATVKAVFASGKKTLTGTLDRVALNGGATFDGGQVNILYEG